MSDTGELASFVGAVAAFDGSTDGARHRQRFERRPAKRWRGLYRPAQEATLEGPPRSIYPATYDGLEAPALRMGVRNYRAPGPRVGAFP
jgi:hypothetical protein